MYNETIIYYSKNPTNKGKLDNFDIEFWEENRTCWDDLKVYLKIDDNKISDWSFEGDTAIITTACASVFGESIVGMTLEEVLTKDYNYITELIESEVSERRRNASVLWLLTTRNAIHKKEVEYIMIKLSKKWSYALKAVIYIAKAQDLVHLADISESEDISLSMLRRIIANLEKAWVLETIKWRNWWIKLWKKVHQISVFDILFAVWEELWLTDCRFQYTVAHLYFG